MRIATKARHCLARTELPAGTTAELLQITESKAGRMSLLAMVIVAGIILRIGFCPRI